MRSHFLVTGTPREYENIGLPAQDTRDTRQGCDSSTGRPLRLGCRRVGALKSDDIITAGICYIHS